MKDKKFVILCLLAGAWALLFIATLTGKVENPRVEELLSLVVLAWFAFWTISFIRSTKAEKTQPKTENSTESKPN